MSLIEKTKSKLRKIFIDHRFQDFRKAHIETLAMSYFIRAKEFLSASEILCNEEFRPLMPYLHLQAQCTELAIKGYLLSSHSEPKKIHDLVKLTAKAESLGLKIEQIEASSIVLLNHYFFEDLTTNTKFKTRYPAKSQETEGGPIPDQNVIKGLYESIVSQANKKCDFLDLLKYV